MTLMEEKNLADHDINVRSTHQELQLLEEQLKKHGRNEPSQSPTVQPDTDTISRQAAIDTCMRKDVRTGYDGACLIAQLPSAQPEITEAIVKEYCEKRCLAVVDAMLFKEMKKRWSSAQPQRKKGEWEMVSQFGDPPTYVYRCSECHHKVFGLSNFCPDCGADMRP